MKFHIPKQHKPSKERIDVKLEMSVLQKLDRYCQYMESDRDYVVGTVLQIVFKKDKGFAAWQKEAELLEAQAASTKSARA
jgi:hypothetical protein